MRILTIVGARPQFVKAAVVSRALSGRAEEILVHTGQHYDFNMSELFFRALALAAPAYNLGIGSGSHGEQTGRMLGAIEEVLGKETPDLVLVYGDTNSTLAGVLAAAKIHIPVAHVEAGLRSFNRRMPEEINRVLTDHLATWLFAPTATAVANLSREGLTSGVDLAGDVMYDAFLLLSQQAGRYRSILETLELKPRRFALLTLHRAENTDDPARLAAILETLDTLDLPVIFPAHPRTRAKIMELGLQLAGKALRPIDPVGYFEMLNLESNAAVILTDSGGVQKEAYMAKTPCITLRDETEWVETVTACWNRLAGADPEKIRAALRLDWVGSDYPLLFGDGAAADRIATVVTRADNRF